MINTSRKPQLGKLEVTGTGNIVIRNTGGSSASEGGMGSGSKDSKEKGELTKQGEGTKSGSDKGGSSSGKGADKEASKGKS